MGLIQTTLPAVEPVTLNEMRLHLRLDNAEENTVVSGVIEAARRYCEGITRRQFVTSTYQLKRRTFVGNDGVLYLPKPQLQSITSIQYVDADGASQTLAASVYAVLDAAAVGEYTREQGRIRLAYDQTWPAVRSQEDAVTITFVAGYGLAANVPDTIKQSIKLVGAHLFENREASVENALKTIPIGIRDLLWIERHFEAA